MKPDKIVCKYCGEQLDGKANKLFCNDAHRMAFVRVNSSKANKSTVKPEYPQPEQQIEGVKKHGVLQNDSNPNKLRDSLTKTDKTFYDRAMKDFGEPYYNFGGILREVPCGYCSTKFKTCLSLNKYCSYGHYHKSLNVGGRNA